MRYRYPLFRIETRRGLGIFRLCGELNLDSVRRVSHRHRAALSSHLHWFATHLPAPDAEIYRAVEGERPITWFRHDAPEMFQRTLDMAVIAREYGHRTRVLKTRSPGTVVYQDDWQVVALPNRTNTLVAPVERRERVCRELIRRARRDAR